MVTDGIGYAHLHSRKRKALVDYLTFLRPKLLELYLSLFYYRRNYLIDRFGFQLGAFKFSNTPFRLH